MTRPQHSPSAFRRYIQLSTKRVFVLVEGKHSDPFFYGQIVRPICDAAGLSWDIVRSEIVTGAGGKQSLVALHEYLRESNSLMLNVGTNNKWCLFYLDKDVDDVMGELIESPHIVYTPYYCVENGLFIHGDLVLAGAAASSLPPENLSARIPDEDNWRKQVAENWKEFLVLCLLSHRLGVNCDCHYGRRNSPLNSPPEAPTNAQQSLATTRLLRAISGIAVAKFDTKLSALRRFVEYRYRKGLHDSLFNGKWYLELFRREINLAAGGRHQSNPANATLVTALILTIDFNGQWTEYFREPLRSLIGIADG